MPELRSYAIRGGLEGWRRLKVLSRVMHPSTTALFERLGVGPGMRCLDLGCGSGDVTLELARRAGPRGGAVGVDIDETKLELARRDAEDQEVRNVEFRVLDFRTHDVGAEFDVVHARFLLTHLNDPLHAMRAIHRHVRPGGLAIIEDIDIRGCFTCPESEAVLRFLQWYCAVVRKRGGDPDIGPRLPLLLSDAGFENVDLAVVQPVGMVGEVKLVNPITLENIADAVVEDGLAAMEEIATVVQELHAFAENPRTVVGLPRIVQAWGRRPAV